MPAADVAVVGRMGREEAADILPDRIRHGRHVLHDRLNNRLVCRRGRPSRLHFERAGAPCMDSGVGSLAGVCRAGRRAS